MYNIIAGENQLTVMKYNVRRDNGVGLILSMEIARESISIGDLESVIGNITESLSELEVYNENSEKVAILSGFHCEPAIIAKGDVYKVELIDASENTYQIGRQKLMIQNLEQKAGQQAQYLLKQDENIAALDGVIAMQDEVVIGLDEIVRTQNDYIEMLEELVATQDEVAIALYEAHDEQKQINTEQDEALIELYEMLGGH